MTSRTANTVTNTRQVSSNRYASLLIWPAIAVVLAISAPSPAHAQTVEKPNDAGPPWPWAATVRAQVMNSMDRYGVGAGLGFQVTRAVTERARIGGAFLAIPITSNTEGGCHYHYECFYSFYALTPVAELHAIPAFFVDPWIRGAVGPAVIGPADQSDNRGSLLGLAASAEIGIAFRLWQASLGPYVGFAGVTGTTGFSLVTGAQIGGEW